MKVIPKSAARLFHEGDEECREYVRTEKIAFGTSLLLPGQHGDMDLGHPHSHEVFFVVEGHIRLNTGDGKETYELFAGDSILIPMGVPHQLANIGDTAAVISWSMAPT